MIGNTQGIKFKINPPINAKSIAEKIDNVSEELLASDKKASTINDSLFIFKIP